MKDLFVRPYVVQLDGKYIQDGIDNFHDAALEFPHGVLNFNVETAVTVKGDDAETGAPIASLTATLAVVLDPFLRFPGHSPTDYLGALFKSEAILTYMSQDLGAVDAYIAIPNGSDLEGKAAAEAYKTIVRRCGYEETVQNCTIFRRSLYPYHKLKKAITPEQKAELRKLLEEKDNVTVDDLSAALQDKTGMVTHDENSTA